MKATSPIQKCNRAELLRQRADRHDEIALIDRQLAELETFAPTVPEYSSAPGGALPPGRSRRWFIERVRTMADAIRDGGKRGRSVTWRISAEAFERALRAKPVEQRDAKPSNVIGVDDWIAGAGYRSTKRSA